MAAGTPREVTVAPRVAPVAVIALTVGKVTIGTTPVALVVNVVSLDQPVLVVLVA